MDNVEETLYEEEVTLTLDGYPGFEISKDSVEGDIVIIPEHMIPPVKRAILMKVANTQCKSTTGVLLMGKTGLCVKCTGGMCHQEFQLVHEKERKYQMPPGWD